MNQQDPDLNGTDGINRSDASDRSAVPLKERAYQSLRKRLLSDGFSPGSLIDDAREAKLLGISRTPVREALLLLQAEGFVEFMPRRGVRVVPITRKDISEVLYILSVLEVAAVELITASEPDADRLLPLTEACEAMDRALEGDDPDEWLEADELFHRSLLSLSGNRHLAETGIRFREKIKRGHFVVSRLFPRSRRVQSTAVHKRLIDLLLTGSPEEAVAAHRAQRQDGEREIIATLRRAKLDSL